MPKAEMKLIGQAGIERMSVSGSNLVGGKIIVLVVLSGQSAGREFGEIAFVEDPEQRVLGAERVVDAKIVCIDAFSLFGIVQEVVGESRLVGQWVLTKQLDCVGVQPPAWQDIQLRYHSGKVRDSAHAARIKRIAHIRCARG